MSAYLYTIMFEDVECADSVPIHADTYMQYASKFHVCCKASSKLSYCTSSPTPGTNKQTNGPAGVVTREHPEVNCRFTCSSCKNRLYSLDMSVVRISISWDISTLVHQVPVAKVLCPLSYVVKMYTLRTDCPVT